MSRTTNPQGLVASLVAAVVVLGAALVAPTIDAADSGAGVAKKKKKATKGIKPITGKLSKSGYTVIALSDSSTNGSAVKVNGRKFKVPSPLSPGKKTKTTGKSRPAVTLHLRAPDGTYAGPVVLAGKSGKGKGKKSKVKKNRAIVGVNAGANLSAIKIVAGSGFAKTKTMPAKSAVDSRRVAQATNGVPIGNGLNVGLVRSTVTGPSTDLDLDGVPNSLDVDDNGNLILDNVDLATTNFSASRGAHSSLTSPHPAAFMSPGTGVSGDTVNAYGTSDADIATAFRTQASLGIVYGGVDPGSAALDCGTLSYCSKGGTGRWQQSPNILFANALPFPSCCEHPQHPGLGKLMGTQTQPDFYGMGMFPGTTPDKIRPGDVLIERATRDGAPVEPVSTVGSVFSTMAALARYDDGQGNTGTLSYPFDGLATTVPVQANGSGDVVLNLTFWRPQRLRIATEPGPTMWMDVGRMSQFAQAQNTVAPPPGPGAPGGACPASTYSTTDPNLSPQQGTSELNLFHFDDLKTDQATNRDAPFGNTFSYTLHLTDCLASYGLTFNATENRPFAFWAVARPPTGKPVNSSSLVTFHRNP